MHQAPLLFARLRYVVTVLWAKQGKSGFCQDLGFNRNKAGERGAEPGSSRPKVISHPIIINSGPGFKSRNINTLLLLNGPFHVF
jgi:hypothetical protein